MAEFAKKLHFLKSGIEQTAKAYSTVDEVGELYAFTKIDGIDCYVPLTTKKYYKKVAWVQPTLTSNTSHGTLTTNSTSTSTEHSAWKAFDGNSDTWFETNKNQTSAYLNWNFGEEFYVTGITVKSRTGDRPNLTIRAYTDKTMGTPIGDALAFTTAGQTQSVTNIPADGRLIDNIYFDCTSTQDYLGVCEITITGYVITESTKDDYDIEEWVNATNGRIIKSGTTYAIKSQAKPAYTEKSWTTAGTYTFTVPDGITRLRVALCGGGAGKGSLIGNGKGGDNTSAFGITVTGGHGGGVAFRKGAGGEPNGHASTGNNVTDGFALSFDKSSGDYGKGGNFGGSGGYDNQYVAVTAGQSYTITVGAAGGSNGTGGFVLLAYGGDI